MIGLDTNVLVRYLTQDDVKQSRAASELIESADANDAFFLSHIVLCELVWVLEEAYRYRRPEIQVALEGILRTGQFRFESLDVLWRAVQDYASGRADFADYLVGRVGKAYGCDDSLTFDKALRSSSSFRVL